MKNSLSIRSIDVGWDPRTVGSTVLLPKGTKCVYYDQAKRGGIVCPEPVPATGNRQQILATLRHAGYDVRFE